MMLKGKNSQFGLFNLRLPSWGICFLLLIFAPTLRAEIKFAGTTYISLKEVATRLGMSWQWQEPSKKILLKSEWTQILFTKDKRELLLNGNRVFLGHAVAHTRDFLYLSKKDFELSLKPILVPQSFAKPPKLYCIVIDPGHGGKDSGARNSKVAIDEKRATLDLAKRLKKRLEAMGYKVLLTRTTDKYIPLRKRAEFANKHKADLFLSLHFNATTSKQVTGIETFILTNPWQPSTSRTKLASSDKKTYPGNRYNAWSTLSAYYIQSAMVKATGGRDRGLKRARWTVLLNLKCPGMLLEGGFISNSVEGSKIASPEYREILTNAIVEGIYTYQKTLNRVRGKK